MSEPTFRTDLRSGRSECFYEPGEIVPRSGIYAVCHADGSEGSGVFVGGDAFPLCSCCSDSVRYRLIRSVPYLYEDEDFRRSR